MKFLSEWEGRERREEGQCTLLHNSPFRYSSHVLVVAKGYSSVCLLISTSLEIVQEVHVNIMQVTLIESDKKVYTQLHLYTQTM